MSKNSGNGVDTAKGAALIVRAQYLKDLSFENPGVPDSLATTAAPQVSLTVDVNARDLGQRNFEVLMTLRVEAENEGQPLFLCEVHYGGVMAVNPEVREDLFQPLLLIEAPRLLFPFARAIVATSVREGGFPPLNVQPIDFAALYQQRLARIAAGESKPAAAEPAPDKNTNST